MKDRAKVFLCHSSRDKAFVRSLANRLRDAGIGIWIDEIEIHIGESLIQRIGQGIHESDLVLAFISADSVESSWVQKELSLAMTKEINGKRIGVLPLLLNACSLPYFLQDKLYADFRDPAGFDAELTKLMNSIEHLMAEPPTGAGDEMGRPEHGGTHSGEVDVGSIVHDRGEEFFGYKVVRNHQKMGVAISFQGLMFGLMAAIPAFVFHNQPMAYLLIFFGLFIAVGGGMLLLAAQFFRAAFDADKRLLVQIEAIGGNRLPFDGKWWRQYDAGRRNRNHQVGLALETGSTIVFAFDIVMLLVLFPIMI